MAGVLLAQKWTTVIIAIIANGPVDSARHGLELLVGELNALLPGFSSSDAAPGCRRFAFVGNTHNYQDGADLTEALCAKLDHKGKVAILVGNIYQDDAAMMLELLYGVVS